MKPDAATLQRIAADKAVKDAAFAHQISQPLWQGSFRSPVPFAPTDSFGTRRMFNGQLASIHRGTDFHAPSGTPVVAANDGVVIIAQGMFYEGNLVVIDHGQQFTTLYMHLSKIEVKAGEHVNKGQRLGLSGATGRVTGPHLHLAPVGKGSTLTPQCCSACLYPLFISVFKREPSQLERAAKSAAYSAIRPSGRTVAQASGNPRPFPYAYPPLPFHRPGWCHQGSAAFRNRAQCKTDKQWIVLPRCGARKSVARRWLPMQPR